MENKPDYQKFSKPLTYFMKKERLASYIASFERYHGDCFGREYIIKSNRKKKHPLYAIFIKKDNKLRRASDIEVLKKVKFIDIIMAMKSNKEEGIGILKTISRYL